MARRQLPLVSVKKSNESSLREECRGFGRVMKAFGCSGQEDHPGVRAENGTIVYTAQGATVGCR